MRVVIVVIVVIVIVIVIVTGGKQSQLLAFALGLGWRLTKYDTSHYEYLIQEGSLDMKFV